MRKIYLTGCLLASSIASLWAQTPTWSEDIAPLIYNNCSSCHHTGSIAPTNLMSYTDVYGDRYNVLNNVQAGIMPPWPPDKNYQHYAQERFLTDAEIDLIADWVNGGAPQGNPNLAPPPPVFSTAEILPNPDIRMRMPAYASQAFTQDDYVCIALDPGITSMKKLRAFEVMPGARDIVHHALVYVDETGNYNTDTVYSDCTGPQTSRLLGAYVPGGNPIIFPNGQGLKMGITINPGAKIILAMHYPKGSAGDLDSTAINLFFYPDGEPGVREIFADAMIQDWGFCIDSGAVRDVSVRFPPQAGVPVDYSVLSVFPHCHMLGKKWDVYGVNLLGQDTVPFIKIPHWDFDWQGFYFFKNIIRLPQWHHIEASCTYDNTTANLHNPNQPPQQVCAGLNTADEMMLVYFHYLAYQSGDELYDMDSVLQVPVTVGPARTTESQARITAFPNPSSGLVTLDYYLPQGGTMALEVLDLQGRVLRQVWDGKLPAGQYHATWDGLDQNRRPLPAGLYFARLHFGNESVTVRMSRQ
jgi:Copper type II ascorbate-dependent monooxygenase, C-terminal domain